MSPIRAADPDALLWASLQAVMASGLEAKRLYLARVVAKAIRSDEPVDEAQLIVRVLDELDGPEVRALARLEAAHDRDLLRGLDGSESAVAEELRLHVNPPIEASLIRSGVVETGVVLGKGSGVSGVNEFGRVLLRGLRESGRFESEG